MRQAPQTRRAQRTRRAPGTRRARRLRRRLWYAAGSVAVAAALTLAAAVACGSSPASSARDGVRSPSGGQTALPSGDTETATVRVGGTQRGYVLHVPVSAIGSQRPIPVVMAFHGIGGSPEEMVDMTGLNDLADRNRFLVVYPQAVEGGWADGRGVTPADERGEEDLGLVDALVDLLVARYPVDQSRMYAVGYSGGALFAQRLGCERSDRFAAVASVAGGLAGQVGSDCTPERPVSVLMVQGDKDPFLPFGGGTAGGDLGGGEVLGAQASAEAWVGWMDCAAQPATTQLPDTVSDGTHHAITTWSRCRQGREVVLHTVANGGHTWPGGATFRNQDEIGLMSRQFSASQVAWEFFVAHPAPR